MSRRFRVVNPNSWYYPAQGDLIEPPVFSDRGNRSLLMLYLDDGRFGILYRSEVEEITNPDDEIAKKPAEKKEDT